MMQKWYVWKFWRFAWAKLPALGVDENGMWVPIKGTRMHWLQSRSEEMYF